MVHRRRRGEDGKGRRIGLANSSGEVEERR
jgi:hypothetical protein